MLRGLQSKVQRNSDNSSMPHPRQGFCVFCIAKPALGLCNPLVDLIEVLPDEADFQLNGVNLGGES